MADTVTMYNPAKNLPKLNLTTAALILICAAALALTGCASAPQNNPNGYPQGEVPQAQSKSKGGYNESELAGAISDHLGVTAESAASTIERLFKKQGRPVGYITGEEGGGALIFGAKYGKGTLWMKDGRTMPVYWAGPTVGVDAGAEISRVFTLVYDLDDPEDIFRRFPGVDGSAFLVAGMAVHYQRANGITLAPVRAGAGVRLGANIGYTSYTRKRGYLPI
ncbi:hypothetical protein GCM10011309_15120 [Litorimonas cladophorae]|uniref:DUF1134 domain-containing protein n=1 Tax=Litorimonas cladophorae TaxID=1220491 RepID=A0A918KJ56_9PROT|nr:EipA family protein [Litorimonas cladophorae]GGX65822.1 hypothetical protein GCM10011309_15120 [Litorimonas cladophorae]